MVYVGGRNETKAEEDARVGVGSFEVFNAISNGYYPKYSASWTPCYGMYSAA